MNEPDFERQFERLVKCYSRKISPQMMSEWWDRLRLYPASALQDAASDWIEESTRFPSLGEIRRLICARMPNRGVVEEEPEPELAPNEEEFNAEAWQLLGKRMRQEIDIQKFALEFKYAAVRHGVADRIDWTLMCDPAGRDSAAVQKALVGGE